MRVIHLPRNVGGHPRGLSDGERVVDINSSIYILWAHSPKGDNRVNSIFRFGFILRYIQLWLSVLKLKRGDVAHFNFGEKLIPFGVSFWRPNEPSFKRLVRPIVWAISEAFGDLDLKLLKMRGVKIAVTFQGDDIRMGEFCRHRYPIHFAHHVGPDYFDRYSDARKFRQLMIWRKYANLIYALNPDLLATLPKRAKFLPYSHLNLEDFKVAPYCENNCPLIVHAPTHRTAKGTQFLLNAVASLRAKGLHFRFKLVENLPYQEALACYREADIVVDQLLSGWYGAVAVEAMAFGKPVVAYIRPEDLGYLPHGLAQDLPIVNANPNDIESVLARLIVDYELRRQIALRSRKFIEKWHDNRTIARQVMRDYEDIVVDLTEDSKV